MKAFHCRPARRNPAYLGCAAASTNRSADIFRGGSGDTEGIDCED
jgi:hypothetical protein